MREFKFFAVLLLGLFFVLQSCEKKQIKPEKELSKLENLKEMTGNDNFYKSADKNNDYILDSLNGVLYKYFPDENDQSFFQNIILKEDDKYDDLVDKWWIEIIDIATMQVYGSGSNFMLVCSGVSCDCMNIVFFGNSHILY